MLEVRSDGLGSLIAVQKRHLQRFLSKRSMRVYIGSYLDIHQDNIGTGMVRRWFPRKVVKGFLSVPHGIDTKVQLLDSLQGNLLVDLTDACN